MTTSRPSDAVGNPTYVSPGSDYQINLNFLPVTGQLPSFTVYRQVRGCDKQSRPDGEVMSYRFPPIDEEDSPWPSFWVSLQPLRDFLPFESSPNLNIDLTRQALYSALRNAAEQARPKDSFRLPKSRFIQEIDFVQRSHAEGEEILVVQPYFLKATQQYGYLFDFHFRKNAEVAFSRRVQQLSLSLDRNFRRNLNYYVDRSSKILTFLGELNDVLGQLRLPGSDKVIQLQSDFAILPADRLRTKVYVFGHNQESKSQFTGLRDFGPLRPLEAPPRLLFMFREGDRNPARALALGLQGKRQQGRFSFPGFEALFKCGLDIDSNPVVLPDLSQDSLQNALVRVNAEKAAGANVVPVIVLPTDDESYLVQKALFSHAEIPTQVCTLRVLQEEDLLKWSLANLALQIFCKAGGQPWKVRPSSDRCLIIGVSQSHKLREVDGINTVDKYFAFSVMTDSSGLFQRIQVLGEGREHEGYLAQLRATLRKVLTDNANDFSRIVIHTSFKLKHREIDAVYDVVRDMASSAESPNGRFAVVKVNQKSRFFGLNNAVNSLVPYEATRLRLGPREYLLWFEGIFPDRTTVSKVFPGPTHLEILRVSDERQIPDEVLLQDLVNLSGANWRGFNAKSTPVSVFYCHLVADLVHNFHEHNLPLPAVQDIRPWFL